MKRRNNKRHTGGVVNAELAQPKPPGWWVSPTRCAVCHAKYAAHKGGDIDNKGAMQLLRAINREAGNEGGGYRSRGPFLWVKRVVKLTHWYATHYGCGEGLPKNAYDGRKALARMRVEERDARRRSANRRGAQLVNVEYVPDLELGF